MSDKKEGERRFLLSLITYHSSLLGLSFEDSAEAVGGAVGVAVDSLSSEALRRSATGLASSASESLSLAVSASSSSASGSAAAGAEGSVAAGTLVPPPCDSEAVSVAGCAAGASACCCRVAGASALLCF